MPPKQQPFLKPGILKAQNILVQGGIAVIPTDTVYGVVGQALNKKTVERIYRLRKRNLKKPMIILISGYADLAKLKIKLQPKQQKLLKKVWPGPVSVILPCLDKNFMYLHRGTNTLAVRWPANGPLRQLLKKTGPLVAPSANIEGKKPAEKIQEAKSYFGDKLDAYVFAGKIGIKPSTLAVLQNGGFKILRQGAFKIPRKYLK